MGVARAYQREDWVQCRGTTARGTRCRFLIHKMFETHYCTRHKNQEPKT